MIHSVSSTTPAAAPAPVKKSDTILSRPFKDYFIVTQEPTEDFPFYLTTTPPELQDELSAYFCAKQEEAIVEQREAAAEARRNPVKLTWEQKCYLQDRYDPRNMSREDYLAFVEDLLEFGILTEFEASYVDADKGGVPLMWCSPLGGTAFRSPDVQVDAAFQESLSWHPKTFFEEWKGNVMDWAKYRASCMSYDYATHTDYQSTADLAFSKMYTVLKQM